MKVALSTADRLVAGHPHHVADCATTPGKSEPIKERRRIPGDVRPVVLGLQRSYRTCITSFDLLAFVHLIDENQNHCLAHMGWRATYRPDHGADASIDFEIHYLMQETSASPKIRMSIRR